jgi:predicted N-acetyltransferase YhbS
MPFQEESVSGTDYLDLVTRLLHRVRLADPTAGLWEASDFQWWWRRGRASDDHGQLFWIDSQGEPVAGVVLTDEGPGRACQCDVIVAPDHAERTFGGVWRRALRRMAELSLDAVEVIVRDDDTMMLDAIVAAGFTATGDTGASSWLDSGDRPGVTPLPEGFRLLSRALTAGQSHHMIARNGADVAARLAQCSLYDPELDLLVQAPNGDVAAYGLFWADPVTGVGLVEPMRTEQQYWRNGLARHILTTGLDLLAAHGCIRLKVSSGHPLYRGVGFTPAATDQTYLGRARATVPVTCPMER